MTSLVDKTLSWLEGLGYTEGTISDRQYQFLADQPGSQVNGKSFADMQVALGKIPTDLLDPEDWFVLPDPVLDVTTPTNGFLMDAGYTAVVVGRYVYEEGQHSSGQMFMHWLPADAPESFQYVRGPEGVFGSGNFPVSQRGSLDGVWWMYDWYPAVASSLNGLGRHATSLQYHWRGPLRAVVYDHTLSETEAMAVVHMLISEINIS